MADGDQVVTPAGSSINLTGSAKPKPGLTIVPKSPSIDLANIRYEFKTGAAESVVYDNVLRKITFTTASATPTAAALAKLAVDANKSASFLAAFNAFLVDGAANQTIDTKTAQKGLGSITKLEPSNFRATFTIDLKDDPRDADTKLTIPELTRLKGNAIDFTVDGAASLNFKVKTEFGSGAFPTIRADLNLDWRFSFPKAEAMAAGAADKKPADTSVKPKIPACQTLLPSTMSSSV